MCGVIVKQRRGRRHRANASLGAAIAVGVVMFLAACGSSKGVQAVTGPTAADSRKPSNGQPATSTMLETMAKAYSSYRGDVDDDDEHVQRTQDAQLDNDADFDNDVSGNRGKGYLDEDDGRIVASGHPASQTERQEVTALIKGYYAAALAGDGAGACRSIYSVFREAIPEDYGSDAGPRYARGKTCAAVMTKVFKHAHAQLAPTPTVTLVRVARNKGYVLVGSKTRPAGYFEMHREYGRWKLIGLLAAPLP